MCVIFMGILDFLVLVLQVIVVCYEVVVVYFQLFCVVGCGQKFCFLVVYYVVKVFGLLVCMLECLKLFEDQVDFVVLWVDVVVVVVYGLILLQLVLDVLWLGCLNIYVLLLLCWWGVVLIYCVVMFGDVEIGVVIMQMEVGLDIGLVLVEMCILIGVMEIIIDLYDWLLQMGVVLIVGMLVCLLLFVMFQVVEGVIYVVKIDKVEVWIDWICFVVQIDRQICGLLLFLGVWCLIDGEWVKLLRLEMVIGVGVLGQVLEGFIIVCG